MPVVGASAGLVAEAPKLADAKKTDAVVVVTAFIGQTLDGTPGGMADLTAPLKSCAT